MPEPIQPNQFPGLFPPTGVAPAPCPCTAMEKAKAVCLIIAAVFTGITSTVGAVAGILNHEKATVIQEHQNANTAKIDAAATAAVEVKEDLKAATAKTTQKLSAIEGQTAKIK